MGWRDHQKRDDLRRSRSVGSPSRGPGKPQPDFNQYTTLSQVRGEVMKMALYFNGRMKLLELYSGSPHEDWFLREVIGGMGELVRYSSGVGFLHRISGKMERAPPEWTKAIFDCAIDMLEFEVSVPLIMNTIEKSKECASLSSKVQGLLGMFEQRSDMIYLSLFQRMIRNFRANDDILYFLYRFQWESRRELYKYFIILLQYVPFDKLRRSVSNLVNNPLTYAGDLYFSNMYAAVLKFVEEERDRMLDYLVTNIDYYFISPDCVIVVKEVINWSTSKQKEALLMRFENMLRQKISLAPFLVEIFDHLLVSTPHPMRVKFLDRNQLSLKSYPSKKIQIIIRYTEAL